MNFEFKLQLSPLFLRVTGLLALLLFAYFCTDPGPVLAVIGPMLRVILQ